MEEKAVVRKFGDEQSGLLDQFERRSFELQLKRAMHGRSLSEAAAAAAAAAEVEEVQRGRRGSRFQRMLKKFLSPVLGKKGGGRRGVPDRKEPLSWMTFSRSLRR